MCEFEIGEFVYAQGIGEAKIISIYGEHYDIVYNGKVFTDIHESAIERLSEDEDYDEDDYDDDEEEDDDSPVINVTTTSKELQMEAAELAYQKNVNAKSDVDVAEEMYKNSIGVEASISVKPLVQDYSTLVALGII